MMPARAVWAGATPATSERAKSKRETVLGTRGMVMNSLSSQLAAQVPSGKLRRSTSECAPHDGRCRLRIGLVSQRFGLCTLADWDKKRHALGNLTSPGREISNPGRAIPSHRTGGESSGEPYPPA